MGAPQADDVAAADGGGVVIAYDERPATTLGLVGQPVRTLDRPCACGGRIVAYDIADCIREAVAFHNTTESHLTWRMWREAEA